MIKLIIFDFDGVIITGSHEGYFNCYHKALEGVGVNLGIEEEKKRIHERWGKHHNFVLEGLLAENSQLLNKAIEIYDQCYSETFVKNVRLIKNADVALERLSHEYTLTIASGMIIKTMNELIKKFNIDYFQQIVTSEDFKNEESKPAPFMIDKIRKDLDFSKRETVMVGDAESDMQMAKNAGVTPIAVLTGHMNKNDATILGVKHIILDITHLPDLLNTLN